MSERVCDECGWPWKVLFNGLCRQCEERRLEAMQVAISHLYLCKARFGCDRIAGILGLPKSTVRHVVSRHPELGRQRLTTGMRVYVCQNPKCNKMFFAKEKCGKYCSRACAIDVRNPNIVKMRQDGHSLSAVARTLNLSISQIQRIWQRHREELGRQDSALR